MKILIDTHCWLWQLLTPERLSDELKQTLSEPANETYFSVASMWEIIIKASIGKLALPLPPVEYIPSRLALLGDRPLAIEQPHVLRLSGLPLHHKDPFDRILVAQAQTEGMGLLTADLEIARYDVDVIWAGDGNGPRTGR